MTSPFAGNANPGANPALDQLRRVEMRLESQPEDAQAAKARASILRGLGRVDQARLAYARALELDPADPQVLLDRAVLGLTHGDSLEEMLPLLRQSLRLAPEHEGALFWLAYAHLLREEFAEAASRLAQVVRLQPDLPHFRFWLGWALRQAGDEAGSQRAFAAMAEVSWAVFQSSRDSVALGYLVQALMTGGRTEEAVGVLRQASDRARGGGPLFSHPHYLPDTPSRLERLRELVGGRDLAIMTYGPSLAELESRIERLAGVDLCCFTFNEPVIERTILSRVGLASDLFCITSPQVLNEQLPWVREFLSRPRDNMLLTHRGAVDGLTEPGQDRSWLETAHGQRLLYFRSEQRYPPVPTDPLHFPPYNTLSVALPLAVLGRPRRIFLFGCDGRAASSRTTADGALFHSPEFHASRFARARRDRGQRSHQSWARSYDDWLRLDTHQFNFQIGVTLAWISHLFQVEVPPIFNCSPGSAYEGFPKIDVEGALKLLGGKEAEKPGGLSMGLRVPGLELSASV